MPVAAQKLQSGLQPQEKFSILLVSPHASDEVNLCEMLNGHGVSVRRRATVGEALPDLDSAAVVMCERDLPDGTWQSVLNECQGRPDRPLVVVISKQADERLWAEVLNLGGYDVLLKPFDCNEVTRVVGMCGRHSMGRSVRQPVASAPSASPFLAAQLA